MVGTAMARSAFPPTRKDARRIRAAENAAAAANVKKAVLKALASLKGVPPDELLDRRYAKLRAMGNFFK